MVSRVIKPPVVNNVNLTLVGNVLRVIPLTGSPDSNGNGVIQTFSIVALPVSGTQYPVFKNGTISGTKVTNPVNLPSQQVAYVYRLGNFSYSAIHMNPWSSGSTAYVQESSAVGKDSFSYRATDSNGLVSVSAVYAITVVSYLI